MAAQTTLTYAFNSAYYSGLDLIVFFNSTAIEELVNIQFQLSKNVLPLYNYAHYRYKLAVEGTRIVQGSFSVNLTDNHAINDALTLPIQSYLATLNVDEEPAIAESLPDATVLKAAVASSQHQEVSKLEDINKLIKQYKQEYWQPNNPLIPETINLPLDATSLDFTITLRYAKKPFDYDYALPRGATSIDDAIENPVAYLESSHAETIITILNARIIGVGQAIDDSGKNILQVYNFIGKDLLIQ